MFPLVPKLQLGNEGMGHSLMGTSCKIHNKGPGYPYFVTSNIVVAWIPVFAHKDQFEIPADSF